MPRYDPISSLRTTFLNTLYDLAARYRSQRETHWVGSKVHLTETCDADHPDLMTPVMTTPATTQDSVMGPVIHQDLADLDVLPGIHLLDSGDVDADLLATAQTQHRIDVIGPPFGSYSRQRREGAGDDLQAFVIDWEAQQARCPQGHPSVHWRPRHDVSGDPVIRMRFDGATCRVCPVRRACTSAKDAPRQLTVRLEAYHEALQAARHRQETTEFTAQYTLRAGWRAASRKGSDVLISAGVGIWGWRARISSSF